MKIHQVENKQDLIWFGSEAPETWNVIRLRFLIDHKTDQVPGKQAGYFYLELEDIESKTGRLIASDREKSPESSVKKFEKGDVLFGRLRPYLAKGWVAEQSGSCVGEILVFRPKEGTDKEFFSYRILADDFIRFVNSAAYGAKMPRVGWSFLADVRIPIPSATEQQTIARFLDHKTTLIDQYIANKKKQIELLEKLRTSVISETVTKGLNPDVEMKDSGVEWCPQMPLDWVAWKVAHAFRLIGSGSTPESGNQAYYGGDTNWITTSELREKLIYETKEKVTDTALEKYSTLKLFEPPALLVAMYGATIGRLGLLGSAATTNQACCVLAKPKSLDIKFTYYWLMANRDNIIRLSSGGGQPNINQEKVKQLKIPAPELRKQREIAEFLDREMKRVDTVVASLNEQVEKIQSYRTSLISEAVTGKIDVRDFKPEPMEALTAETG